MKAPFFTVLIDTYNYGQYIEEAIASVLAQDFPAEQREILVVDDGSTDDTPERVQKFGDAVRYLRKPNGGQASAFNFGFEHARGEIVALLDADDVWLPEKLGRIYEAFEHNPAAGMVYHRVYLWKGPNETSEDTYFISVSGNVTESRRTLLQYPMVGTSCLAFRRDALKKLLPVPEALRSQADAYLTALIIFVAPVAAVAEFLGKYRLHGANLFQNEDGRASRSQIEHRMAMRAVLLSSIEGWLRNHGYETGAADIRAYLKQWTKAQELDAFALEAPSRWKYFRHLLEYPRIYGEIMTGRHRANSYLRAIAALFLGYHHLHRLDDVRMKRKRRFPSSAEKNAAAEKEKEKALAAKG
jgi:glycosyltransferase involved in cell wall biosynthesis